MEGPILKTESNLVIRARLHVGSVNKNEVVRRNWDMMVFSGVMLPNMNFIFVVTRKEKKGGKKTDV